MRMRTLMLDSRPWWTQRILWKEHQVYCSVALSFLQWVNWVYSRFFWLFSAVKRPPPPPHPPPKKQLIVELGFELQSLIKSFSALKLSLRHICDVDIIFLSAEQKFTRDHWRKQFAPVCGNVLMRAIFTEYSTCWVILFTNGYFLHVCRYA